MKTSKLSLNDCQAIINNKLVSYLENIPKQPDNLYAPIRYILSTGGKRIRPCLVLMACNLYTNDIDHAINPALAMEVFHNFTLLHDDIMDNADMRRGNQTVHTKWDENIAILSGDAMSIMGYDLLGQTRIEFLPQILHIFTQTALQVCDGQQYDMDFESTLDVSIDDYLKMIELKTSVLIAGSLKIGAILGKANKSDATNLYDFGLYLGLAFQLQDDYLDAFGNEEKFGKTIGGDIVANKKTFLLIKALELANESQKLEIIRLSTTENLGREEKISAFKNIYNELKVAAYLRTLVEDYYQKSLTALKNVSITESEKKELMLFAENLLTREH